MELVYSGSAVQLVKLYYFNKFASLPSVIYHMSQSTKTTAEMLQSAHKER